ncbi:hypothetical protein BA190_10170 [Labrys sp. WJW]|uniref:baseplate J/gp47 family protein n=1 Tax=Labrys sp. WJW TaxID=1737983 RepID=UPI00082B31B9|nr:baseplate J/gp47 family protein [Labrys sp. WJW]OCC05259.1 hypothetical protein BA190_10170 [Labrys sp. WJW]
MADLTIDALAALGKPDIIETLDYEAILRARKAKFLEKLTEHGLANDVIDLETDPGAVLLEESSYRELVLRARGNDIARDRYLYFARGPGLDHMGAFYDCFRLVDEKDDRYKQRIILAIQGRSPGGTAPRYKSVAMGVSLDVADVNVYTNGIDPTVWVAVFSVSNNGVAPQALLDAVSAALNAPEVKMVNDTIKVRAAVVVIVDVTAALTLLPDTPESILASLSAGLPGQWAAEGGSGRDLTRDWIRSRLMVSGVYSVAMSAPAADRVMQQYEAVRIGNVALSVAGRAY